MKTFALILALAFSAPLAAQAATPQSQNNQLIQKIQSTYHTHFTQSGG